MFDKRSKTPFQGDRILVATVTGNGTTGLGDLLEAIASKSWTGSSTDHSNWRNAFGVEFPNIQNCQIELTGTADWSINHDGVAFPIAAGTIKLMTCQDLNQIIPNGTIFVLIQY